MSKFKVGDKVVKADGEKWTSGEKYKFITKINFWREEYLLSNSIGWWDEKELKLYEGVKEMKELTFKEVIANIKENEVWECTRKDARVKKIRMVNDLLVFDYGDTITEKQSAIRGTDTFKLQRKEYTFEEAFKAYEEGKEIESGSYKYKKCNGADCFKLIRSIKDEWIKCEDGFEIHLDEIRGKWYIND